MKKITSLALLFGAVSSQTQANPSLSQDEQLKLPGVVVTASRNVETLKETSSAVTVFTRADIDRLQPRDVIDLLQRAPGVHLTQTGGRGSMTGIFLRGTSTAQSLVLIDGVRTGSASNGAISLETLTVDQIERVEVLRGSRSVIYGADAIGGVIQIFTRKSEKEGFNPRFRLAYGSHQTWERSVGISGGDDRTRISLNLASEETNGFNRSQETTGADQDRDAYRNHSVSASLSHHFSDSFRAGINLLDQRGEAEYDLDYNHAYPYDELRVTNVGAYGDWAINERWTSRLELGYNENHNVNRFDDVPDKSHFITERPTATWLNRLELNDQQSLMAGLDWYEDRLDSSTQFTEKSRWNRALFLQHRYQGSWFATELGARHDRNEAYGNETTLSSAFTWMINPHHDLILSYSEGFRAPSFNDLYYPGYSNPNLDAETSHSFEVQWRALFGSTSLDVALYRTDIDDAIASNSANNWIPQNIASVRVHGLEVSLQREVWGWDAVLAASMMDAEDRETGKQQTRRPRRTLSLDLDRGFGPVTLGGSLLAISRSYEDPANTQAIPGYALVNLRASVDLSHGVKASLTVDNLFDKSYASALYSVYDANWNQIYFPYNDAGRTAMLTLTWTPEL